MVEDQKEQDPEAHPEGNTFMFTEGRELEDRIPIDFAISCDFR